VGAVKFPNQAQFHPLKFINSICNSLNICEHTHIQGVKGDIAFTDSYSIKAEKIVFATHFPFVDLYGFYPLKLYQHRSYVIALENAAQIDGMFVDESDNGLSFRNYGDYLLLGGGDHRTGKNGGNWNELRKFAAVNYPFAREKYSWAAQDCMSLDSIPYIGRYSPSKPDWYVMTGFNKWGMTGSMAAAMLVCDMLMDRQRTDAEIFSPSRSILHKQLFINTAETLVNMLTLTPKRCPHLGCALKWNKAEHSWDCACHGSRFTHDGRLIDNPANKNIKCNKSPEG
jgi:glycine/D-amino acid oxidase-like deaminating enzyme